MGGYVAFPGGIAAVLRRIPLVVHEQNAIAGTTNRILAQMARRVLTGFPGVLPNAEVVGNPVRRDFDLVPPPEQRFVGRSGPLKLLVVGGSLGANILNTVVPQSLALLPPTLRPQVIHQAGEQQLEPLRQAYAAVQVQADCRTFIKDIAQTLAQVDVVLCRAGAMTVTEVAAVGVAALFVPFPHAIDDHQTANARYLSQGGAAWICPQVDLTPQWLADWLRCRQREELQQVAHKAHQRALPQAAQHIADICEQVAFDAVGRRAKSSS
jgi:UDP-N-acetylglucosamine--N-acetylmuramyl-(pentapeptide) pyrophosphoryl-undecaprenol N-acetylglucosamine transferase